QIHAIQPLGDHHRVVERRPGEPAPVVRLEGLPHRPGELGPGPRGHRGAGALERRPGWSLGIRRVEAACELRVEQVEPALIAPARYGALRVDRVSTGPL